MTDNPTEPNGATRFIYIEEEAEETFNGQDLLIGSIISIGFIIMISVYVALVTMVTVPRGSAELFCNSRGNCITITSTVSAK